MSSRPQHLESFKSIENIVNTKYELADAVGGKVFLNTDNEYIAARLPEGCVRYGTGENTDYRANVVSVSRKGTSFTVTYPDGGCHTFQTVLIGAHNVVNLCGAVAMADSLGVPVEDIQYGIKRIQPVPHRMQLLEKGPVTIIDDAFNSNPSGCKAALETMALFSEYKILITPGMVELGEQEEALNNALIILSNDGPNRMDPEKGCTMSKVESVGVIMTKADLMPTSDPEKRLNIALDYLRENFSSFMSRLSHVCKQFGINKKQGKLEEKEEEKEKKKSYLPYIFTFSLGEFYPGNTLLYNHENSMELASYIERLVPPERGWNPF